MMLIYTALNQEGDYRMNLESKIECIKKVLEKQLKSIDNENDNYSLKVKKDYQKNWIA